MSHFDPAPLPEIEQQPVAPSAPASDAFWSYSDVGILLLAVPIVVIGCGLLLLVGMSTIAFFQHAGPQAGAAGAAMASKASADPATLIVTQFLVYAILLLILTLIFHRRYGARLFPAVGFVFPAGPWTLVRCVLAGPVVAVSVNLLGALLHVPKIPSPFEHLVGGPFLTSLFVIFAVIIGPAFEELVFRGFVFPLLRRDLGVAAAIVLTSVSFGLIHGPQYQWKWQILLILSISGAIFGLTRQWTGSTLASTVVHSAYNATLVAAFLARGGH